jgi:hypothetical protein
MADNNPSSSPAINAEDKQAREIAAEIGDLVKGLAKEGERAAVVVGAARLDLALEHLLKKAMHPHPGGSDNLFDQERPLGTFFSKIALAYRLGLIDKDVEQALQLVRKIRNNFAHSVGAASLSESAHSSRLLELSNHCRAAELYGKLADHPEITTPSKGLTSFSCSLAVLLICIEVAALGATTPNVPHPARLSGL